jgi:c-di-GMP-binding flagellar brake protein YcgR
MTTNYKQIKSSIYKWRANNKEEYNKYMLEVYYRNADDFRQKRMKRYYYQQEVKRLMAILL